jgi:hypothetical protein
MRSSYVRAYLRRAAPIYGKANFKLKWTGSGESGLLVDSLLSNDTLPASAETQRQGADLVVGVAYFPLKSAFEQSISIDCNIDTNDKRVLKCMH